MKRILVICDGMADEPTESLNMKTPLQAAHTPAMDWLAAHGRCGALQTVPAGHYPGSEVAILTILGYSPAQLPAGRGALEASGLGIEIPDGHIAMRYIIKENQSNQPNPALSADSSMPSSLRESFPGFSFHPFSSHSGLCVAPYCPTPKDDSSSIDFWSAAKPCNYPPFSAMHRGAVGAIVGAVPLLRGIANEVGLEWIATADATGDCHTDYHAKGIGAIHALENNDIVIVHIEACDFASHSRDAVAKVKAIENIDSLILSPMLTLLKSGEKTFAIAVMSDHPSLCATGNHTSDPAPFLYYYPGIAPDAAHRFDEAEVRRGSLTKISEIYG